MDMQLCGLYNHGQERGYNPYCAVKHPLRDRLQTMVLYLVSVHN
jgi:hypothetical protein